MASVLHGCNFGILVLTPENIASEWILFEAGALAKHLGEARVVPLLIQMTASQLRSPLSDFQAIRLEEDLLKLALALNEAQPDPCSTDVIQERFRWTHSQFLSTVKHLLERLPRPSEKQAARRPIDELLEEILQTVKGLRRSEIAEPVDFTVNEQYYPTNDRIQLYKFLRRRVELPLYRNASMRALFNAAARFLQDVNPGLSSDDALSTVAKYLVSERPLQDLLEGFEEQDPGKG